MCVLPTSRRPTSRDRKASPNRFLTSEDGSTAVEFGMVGLPFLLFVLAIMGYGLYFFTESSLEYGVEAASRKIRTGEVNSAGTQREDHQVTNAEFKRAVCTAAGALIDCSKLRVHVQSKNNWIDINPPSCTNAGGGMADSTGQDNDPISSASGGASQIVMVTVCYQFDPATTFSFLMLPSVLQAATAFKSEPYSG